MTLGGRLPPNAVVDEVWALGSRAMWFTLAERGWSPGDWEAWFVRVVLDATYTQRQGLTWCRQPRTVARSCPEVLTAHRRRRTRPIPLSVRTGGGKGRRLRGTSDPVARRWLSHELGADDGNQVFIASVGEARLRRPRRVLRESHAARRFLPNYPAAFSTRRDVARAWMLSTRPSMTDGVGSRGRSRPPRDDCRFPTPHKGRT